MRIEIPVFDGFDELDAVGPYEVLAGAGLEVALVAVSEPGRVVGQSGIVVEVEQVLGRADVVLVPGGGWLNHAPEGSWAQAQRGVLPARLRELSTTVDYLAAVCTGSLLLASAGLLEGRHATTNRNAVAALAELGVETVDARVVDDGDRVTAGGLTAGLDLGLWMVERALGTAAADDRAAGLEYVRQGRVWKDGAVVRQPG